MYILSITKCNSNKCTGNSGSSLSLCFYCLPKIHFLGGDARAVYGLTSLFGADVAGAVLVANPGCYATAVITALAPVIRHELVEPTIAVSAGSGVTGAGRTADEAMSLGEMYGEVRA